MNNLKKNSYLDVDLKLLCFTLLLFLSLSIQGAKHYLLVNHTLQKNEASDDSVINYHAHERYIIPPILLYETANNSKVYQLSLSTTSQTTTNKELLSTPLLALKTNLLFDALTALNFEIEIPIKERWSIAGEWMFPWWQHTSNRAGSKPWRLEVLCGTLEGRYWLSNRQKYSIMKGWFAGVFTGAGIYDVQWKAKGYQGDFFIMSGVSAGYAHRITPYLSLEYSLGIGFFNTRYRYYKSIFGPDCRWHPIEINTGRYQYVGPLRAKISLVWILYNKWRKGGSL